MDPTEEDLDALRHAGVTRINRLGAEVVDYAQFAALVIGVLHAGYEVPGGTDVTADQEHVATLAQLCHEALEYYSPYLESCMLYACRLDAHGWVQSLLNGEVPRWSLGGTKLPRELFQIGIPTPLRRNEHVRFITNDPEIAHRWWLAGRKVSAMRAIDRVADNYRLAYHRYPGDTPRLNADGVELLERLRAAFDFTQPPPRPGLPRPRS
jgi:hypothetical protein